MFHTQRGKWGMASFTSTRTIGKIPGQKAYQAQQATSYAFDNAEESAIAATATTPKPRKFFKSRASAGAQEPQIVTQPHPQDAGGGEHVDYQSAVVAQEAAPAPKQKSKHSKKKTTAIQEYFVPPAVQPAVEPEPAEYIPQPSVSQDRIRETIPSKRYLARTRKVQVNYNEDENSQPARPVAPPIVAPALTVPISAVSPSMEHPPIVLRISKGTSRLVSTDSEEANNASPPHQTPTSPHSSLTNYDTNITQSTSSVANGVIKEKTVSVPSPTPQPTTPLSNRGTRKRRSAAAATAAAAPVPAPSTPETPPGQPRRTTRAIRRQQEEEELRTEQEQTAEEEEEVGSEQRPRTPEPGSANYDLYRTLASSPEPEERKPQPQTKIRNKKERATVPEKNMIPESVPDVQKAVPAKRGRKKKGEEVAPPTPDVVNAVPVVEELKVEKKEEEEEEEAIPQKPVPGRRGRKPKGAVEEVAALPVTPKKPRVEENTAAATPSSSSSTVSPRRSTRGAVAAQQVTPTKMEEEPRAGAVPAVEEVKEEEEEDEAPQPPPQPVVKSYGRKRKGATAATVATSATVPHSPSKGGGGGSGKKATNGATTAEESTPMEVATDSAAMDEGKEDMDDKPLVKLVISKKKGSIFKSRALASNEEVAKNRPVYKHKWDVDEEERNSPKAASGAGGSSAADKAKSSSSAAFDGDFDEADPAKPVTGNFKPHRRALMASNNTYGSGGSGGGGAGGASTGSNKSSSATTAQTTSGGGGGGGSNSHFNDKQTQQRHAAFYTVKQAHQIQEIGEFQEMDDDVEYILDTLQPKYPILTRCLSAMQLSTKCMTPEFRMHVRAHGTVTQFFRVLQDAPKDRSLALCTASILFVLSQDNIGMDLDKESLELMLNLLECDEVQAQGGATTTGNPDDLGLTEQQAARNKMKVRELCEEVKGQGKAPHLNLDNVTTGALAMETLLSLTSKRAGEWFKEELRTLGGLEHIVKTVCECCRQISDYVAVWTEGLLEKLRKIERCLRVLDNVMEMNEQNQSYILHYDNGGAINVLVKLYQLCDTELALYPTTAGSPKDSPGVAIREALVPTLKVLISLTHSFSGRAMGAQVVGEKGGVFETSLHLLFHSSNYVPENCVFELSILVLLLMTNMTMHTPVNRAQIMEANALSDFGSQFAKMPAIKALVEFFYKCEESARLAEENADAILDAKPKKEKSRKGEEIEETVTKILQKAGNHMEHTIMASYVCILIGHLVMHDDEHRRKMSAFLRPDAGFAFMAKILEKYYNFMNLTASAEALTVAHIEATKKIIDYLTQCDGK